MDLRDPVARMLNTCLIGRRWKPREGWSRPVLTGDGDTTIPILLWGWFRVFPVLDRPGRQYALGWSLNDTTIGVCLASASRFPNRHMIIEWPEWPPCSGCRSVIAVLRWS